LFNQTTRTALKFEGLSTKGIPSYYCVILKMVILEDAIKNLGMGLLCFPLKKNKNLFLNKKQKKVLNTKTQWVDLKKNGFSQP